MVVHDERGKDGLLGCDDVPRRWSQHHWRLGFQDTTTTSETLNLACTAIQLLDSSFQIERDGDDDFVGGRMDATIVVNADVNEPQQVHVL